MSHSSQPLSRSFTEPKPTTSSFSPSRSSSHTASGCEILPQIANGEKMYLYDNAMTRFSCSPGYSLEGSPALSCDGINWNDTMPVCVGEFLQCLVCVLLLCRLCGILARHNGICVCSQAEAMNWLVLCPRDCYLMRLCITVCSISCLFLCILLLVLLVLRLYHRTSFPFYL